MGDKTAIAWTQASWNPLRGCTRVSAGCEHCYAEQVAARFSGPGQPYEGLAILTPSGARWTRKVVLVEEHLRDPLRWQRPRRVFTNSMSDLFHESVPDEWLYRILAVMAAAKRHTFQTLTKRAERMRDFLTGIDTEHLAWHINQLLGRSHFGESVRMPLRNCWWGVSVEDEPTARLRLPHLMETPAAIRFISYEPILGPVNFQEWLPTRGPQDGWHGLSTRFTSPTLDWIILGGESGPRHRPCKLEWIESAVHQCQQAGVPVFVKQDSGSKPGKQGRIPDALWALKEYPQC